MLLRITKLHAIAFLAFLLGCNGGLNKEFDKEKWRAGDAADRGDMATDLISNHTLKGKSKLEILELLGQPKDSSDIWFGYVLDYGYSVGFRLNIVFDSVDYKVTEVMIED